MNQETNNIKQTLYRIAQIALILFILVSCEPFNTNTSVQTGEPLQTDAVFAETPRTATLILPELPSIFQTSLLDPLDVPRTYVDETCRYLRNKWNPLNAKPGTVVLIIRIGVIQTGAVTEENGINVVDFMKTMQELKAQGFEAITMKEFLYFIERNIYVPPRSVLIIQDGNYEEEYFYKNYRQYWEDWSWPVVNGWQSDFGVPELLRQENIDMEYEGWVDHQAHGVIEDTKLSDDSSKTVIARELQDSLDTFASDYGKTPIAFIWPNGGFGQRPVEAARQLGYQLGFTANSRGPVMYNWIPLSNEFDSKRPEFIPEAQINDPLMTLPRYPADQAYTAVDQVRTIGEAASAYAQANKEDEFNYYEIVCSETYGPIPTPK